MKFLALQPFVPSGEDFQASKQFFTELGFNVSWDAGDYLKFVETTSYTIDMMQLGVRDFPNQMGAGSTPANFTAEAKFGLDWLQHMWDDTTQTLYYQVGIGTGNSKIIGDHDIWRLPQADGACSAFGTSKSRTT